MEESVAKTVDRMDQIVSLCKRRGFVFQSSEIYGGLGSCWDYGPYGVELKRNLKDFWWKAMTQKRDDVEGVDAAILMHPKVWETSGHVANFTDPLVDCKKCKARFRADQLESARCPLKPSKSPLECGGELTEPRLFNLMFKTFMGPVEDSSAVVYMRPETAQGIYVNFLNVMGPSRQKVPFGIAQIGKAFRNEITPGNFIFRTREFEQMEMQFFVRPGSELDWFEKWKETRINWHRALGFGNENYRFHVHEKLAHYANAAVDIEYKFPFGFKEVEGIHSRTDFDLSQHQQFSGKKIQYFDPELNESYVPYVVETSIGVDRMFLQVVSAAYHEEVVEGADGKTDTRVVLKLPAVLAPVKLAVMPLVKKDGLPEKAREIIDELKFEFNCQYDEKDSIGKRYRRQDAIGTPFCITVDHQTAEDNTVTIRYRDTMLQERVNIAQLRDIIAKQVSYKTLFEKLK